MKFKGSKPCPSCGMNKCGVTDSRPSKLPNILWRRALECSSCGHRFSTHEVIVSERGSGVTMTNEMIAVQFLADMEEAMLLVTEKHYGDIKTLRHSSAAYVGKNVAKDALK